MVAVFVDDLISTFEKKEEWELYETEKEVLFAMYSDYMGYKEQIRVIRPYKNDYTINRDYFGYILPCIWGDGVRNCEWFKNHENSIDFELLDDYDSGKEYDYEDDSGNDDEDEDGVQQPERKIAKLYCIIEETTCCEDNELPCDGSCCNSESTVMF